MVLKSSRKHCKYTAGMYFKAVKFLRAHWYDLGAVPVLVICVWLAFSYDTQTPYRSLMWLSLIALFLHQLEEYRVIGTFPGMVNSVLFASPEPERYPLNPQTALVVNVAIGWTTYLLAALLAERAVWLGMATILVSAGNVLAHTLLFNIRGRRFFNAGMITSILLFLPIVVRFFRILQQYGLADWRDYALGFAAGILLNYVGILKLIQWLADPQTPYAFEPRQMLRR